jgi:hypothetical protein
VALSNAGRLYAGRLNGGTLNGVSVVDPVQFYCQPNVTLLSTDGYWNQGAGFQWDGTTAVGDQDGPGLEVRPQLDGGPWKQQKITTQITETQTPTQATQAQITSGPVAEPRRRLVEEKDVHACVPGKNLPTAAPRWSNGRRAPRSFKSSSFNAVAVPARLINQTAESD